MNKTEMQANVSDELDRVQEIYGVNTARLVSLRCQMQIVVSTLYVENVSTQALSCVEEVFKRALACVTEALKDSTIDHKLVTKLSLEILHKINTALT